MMKQVAGRLRLELAQYRELADFARFGSDLDKATVAQLTRGEKLVEILKQDQYIPMSIEKQVVIIFAATRGYLDDIPTGALRRFEGEFHDFMEKEFPDVMRELSREKKIEEAVEKELGRAIDRFKKGFVKTI
jgi:F-type H+-transporting ATPase subunit alpha